MRTLRFYAVTASGTQPLPVPENVTSLDDLFKDLPLGVYSALRTFEHNKFLCLDEHLARTRRSMALLGWSYRLDERRLREALHAVCTAFPSPEMRVRFDVLAAPAERLGTDSRVLIALMAFAPPPPHYYTQGVGVDFARALHRERPLAKTATFAEARAHAFPGTRTQDAYEFLLVSPQGKILEGTGTNFWAVRDGTVWTAGAGVLEGVTRKIILDLLPQLGLPLRLEAVDMSDVDKLDEAALSGSSRAFLPVVKIAGQTVGNGRPGPVSARILDAYNAFVAANIETAVA